MSEENKTLLLVIGLMVVTTMLYLHLIRELTFNEEDYSDNTIALDEGVRSE